MRVLASAESETEAYPALLAAIGTSLGCAGSLPHNVVITKGPHKGTISKVRTKGTVSKKFNTKGAYTIVCQIHAGMTLRLQVT